MLECDCGGAVFNGICLQCGSGFDDDDSYDSVAGSDEDLYEIHYLIDEAEEELAEEAVLGVNPRTSGAGFDWDDEKLERDLDEETQWGYRPERSTAWSMDGEYDVEFDELFSEDTQVDELFG